MALLNPLSHAFGIDIGDRAFKLAQFSPRRNGYQLTAWGNVDVPEGVLDRGEVLNQDKAAELLVQLLKNAHGQLRGRAVVACLPEAKTFVKIIEIPRETTDEGLKRAVLTEIEQNIPLPQDEIYYDWQVLPDIRPSPKKAEPEPDEGEPTPAEPADGPKPAEEPPAEPAKAEEEPDDVPRPEPPADRPPMTRVLMGAAPKNLVDSYTAMLERAGLAPIALEIEAVAIARALVPSDLAAEEAVGVLDIGATRSSLVIFDGGSVQMSISIPISGIEITKTVSQLLNVSMEDAEVLKRECGLDADRCEDKMWKILLPLIDDMTSKIRNALRFYRIGFPQGKKIEKLYLCGGGALFREIDTVLSRKLTIKVRRGNPLINLTKRLPKAFQDEQALTYATAIGLGLDAADENRQYRRAF